MAAPVMTKTNAAGNLLASTTIAASGVNTTANVDASTVFEAQIQVSVTFGTVSSFPGLLVEALRRIGSGPANDTVPAWSMTVPGVASSTQRMSMPLPTGRYNIKLTNLDGTNAVTGVTLTSDTVDSV
jgi:hypothetical protein